MDSNQAAITGSFCSAVLAPLKLPQANDQQVKPKEPEIYKRLNIDDEHQLNKGLFQDILNPNLSDLLELEEKTTRFIKFFGNQCTEVEEKIAREKAKIEATDNTGGNFEPGEEEDIDPPQWTKKGTYCESTRYIREQVVKRCKFETLLKQKITPDKLTPPDITDRNGCFEEIDLLFGKISKDQAEKYILQAKDCDQIRELVGPDHAIARRYQRLILNKIHFNHLQIKRKSLDIVLAQVEFQAKYKLYSFYKKTAENMQAFIDTIPKYHSNKLFCRNKTCKDCQHETKPSLAKYGLQKKASTSRPLSPEPQRHQSELSPQRSKYRRTVSPQDSRSSPARSYRHDVDNSKSEYEGSYHHQGASYECYESHDQSVHEHSDVSVRHDTYDRPADYNQDPYDRSTSYDFDDAYNRPTVYYHSDDRDRSVSIDHYSENDHSRGYVGEYESHRGMDGHSSRRFNNYDRDLFESAEDAREYYKDSHPSKKIRQY